MSPNPTINNTLFKNCNKALKLHPLLSKLEVGSPFQMQSIKNYNF